MSNIKTGKQFFAASMNAIERGLPLLSIERSNGLFRCKIQEDKKTKDLSLIYEDINFVLHIDSKSDLYRYIKIRKNKYCQCSVYIDNVYYKKTDEIKRFINLIKSVNFDNTVDCDDKFEGLSSYYAALDRDASDDLFIGTETYIVVDTVEEGKPYYIPCHIGDGICEICVANRSFEQQVFNMEGKRMWSPFLKITDRRKSAFGLEDLGGRNN